jgi:DNA modification methylase
MEIIQNIQVPTGNILIVQGSRGKPLELLSIGDYGIRKIIPQADDHPTPKPIQLAIHFIQLHSEPGDIVLDPFCGHGWGCVAAKMLGRRYLGIDISEDYCRTARERLAAVDTGVSVRESRAGQLSLFAGKGEL